MTRSKRTGRRGAALVEALVAAFLVGMAAMLAVAVVAAAPQASGPFDRLDMAMLAAGSLSERLKAFVTADAGGATRDLAPGGSWSLGGADARPALEPGEHDAAHLLPPAMKEKGGTLRYTVETLEADGEALTRVTIRAGLPGPE